MTFCDLCGKDLDGPSKLIVSHPSAKSWEMDVCDDCYRKHYAWKGRKKAQPTARVAGRPQARMQRTVLPPQPVRPPEE
jgi:ribosome-binding protein aMBF1 (putative translation factor)